MTEPSDTSSLNSSADAAKAASEKKEVADGWRDFSRALTLCLLAVVAVRSFLFEPFKIPTGSMIPTLLVGDHIFVSKYSYGLSITFTKIEFAAWSAPKRGDVIVFLYPRDEAQHYVKRVIGIPGDRVEFKGKDLFINGKLIEKELIADSKIIESVMGGADSLKELYRETIDGVPHYVRYNKNSSGYDFTRTTPVYEVPPDKFFVAGDNRDDSNDSRTWGFVPRENIKGKAQLIWLSLDKDEKWNTGNKIRWSRCTTLIQ